MVSRADVERAKELKAAGWTFRKIGKELGISDRAIAYALKREKRYELSEDEKSACDRFAEELLGGAR